ncbi:hypothetical protein IQ273_19230 [Nodosilinea sp. LEGE 07298]|uniref:hypothetical protein n=1 Tax=Nodosilinea sp. LEGE 07298 TaxID=2777970 RepID=UPI0018830D48|nr:hypothetical protein [Nodosilinea sp. LEGE 07298]MBE9111542.1 hypothetical protein [Nodosilinea sp. LEGE 07298]
MTTNSRPFGVTLIATLMLITGLTRTILEIFLMANNPYAQAGLERALPEIKSAVTGGGSWSFSAGVVFLILGLLGLLASYGMFTLKGWAWVWTTFVVGMHFFQGVNHIFDALFRSGGNWVLLDGLLTLLIFGLVFFYLLSSPVKRVFGTLRQG